VDSGGISSATRCDAALAAADQIGIRAVLVDAIDDKAGGFYRRHGFRVGSGRRVNADGPDRHRAVPARHLTLLHTSGDTVGSCAPRAAGAGAHEGLLVVAFDDAGDVIAKCVPGERYVTTA
jgi:hypothetical protein